MAIWLVGVARSVLLKSGMIGYLVAVLGIGKRAEYLREGTRMSDWQHRSVMITGGTGSFGKACAQRLLALGVRRLILFSRDEQKHVHLRREVFPPDCFPAVRFFVGDVRDRDRLRMAMRDVDYVIHAAAMKHVDIAEYNPQECIHTNVGGAENVIQAALECGVQKVVALSTDKAANPINLYGATKLCSDKLFVAANSLAGENGARFAVVRYGNVLGSNGSVVPLFQRQRASGCLTLTDPNMTRFIITLDQGIDLVMTAFEWMTGGEMFVPEIPSTTIPRLGRAIAPPCAHRITGGRPGGKLHECMIPADEAHLSVEFSQHFIIQPALRSWTAQSPAYPETGISCPEGFSYASDNNRDWLSVEDLRQLIARHAPEANRPAVATLPQVA